MLPSRTVKDPDWCKAIPCRLAMEGNCPHGNRCRFYHPKSSVQRNSAAKLVELMTWGEKERQEYNMQAIPGASTEPWINFGQQPVAGGMYAVPGPGLLPPPLMVNAGGTGLMQMQPFGSVVDYQGQWVAPGSVFNPNEYFGGYPPLHLPQLMGNIGDGASANEAGLGAPEKTEELSVKQLFKDKIKEVGKAEEKKVIYVKDLNSLFKNFFLRAPDTNEKSPETEKDDEDSNAK